MKNDGLRLSLAAAVLAALTGFGAAQSVSISRDGRPERMAAIHLVKGLNMVDTAMLQDMYWGNAMEIRAGQDAESRGSSTWTRQFGKDMVREHTFAQNEVRELANRRGVSLRNDLPGSMVRSLHHLETCPKSRFDAGYRHLMLASHAEASNVLKRAIQRGHDEEVRGLATKLEPSVIRHYQLAMTGHTMTGSMMVKGGS